MSTSYYWILDDEGKTREEQPKLIDQSDEDSPSWHIGKVVSAGRGKPSVFYWASDPVKVARTCSLFPDTYLIADEYGEEFSGDRFFRKVAAMDQNYDNVGERFS